MAHSSQVLPDRVRTGDWRRVHLGALRYMMQIPSTATATPLAFTILADGMARAIEAAAAVPGPAELERALVHVDGGNALIDLLAIAPTVESCVSLVRAIATAMRLLPLPFQKPNTNIVAAWMELERHYVPWCLHLIASQLPGSTGYGTLAKELATSIVVDAEHEHELKQYIHDLLPRLVEVILARGQPPVSVTRAAAGQTITELLATSTEMLTDPNDPQIRRYGAQFLGYALRVAPGESSTGQNGSAKSDTSEAVGDLMRKTHPRIRQAAPWLVRVSSRLLVSNHGQAKSAYLRIAAACLDPNISPHVPTVLSLYRALMETISAAGPVDHKLTGDVTKMLRSGALTVSEGLFSAGLEVKLGGPDDHGGPHAPSSNLAWALYHTLRRAMPQHHAVLEAREVLLGLICTHEPSQHWRWRGKDGIEREGIEMWEHVMEDPHAPCALMAAERVVRVAALRHYECYEAAASTDNRHPYHMARFIYQTVTGGAHNKPTTPAPAARAPSGNVS